MLRTVSQELVGNELNPCEGKDLYRHQHDRVRAPHVCRCRYSLHRMQRISVCRSSEVCAIPDRREKR